MGALGKQLQNFAYYQQIQTSQQHIFDEEKVGGVLHASAPDELFGKHETMLKNKKIKKSLWLSQAHRCVLFGHQSCKVWEISHLVGFSEKLKYLIVSKEQLSPLSHSPHHSLMCTVYIPLISMTCLTPALEAALEHNDIYVCICMSFTL